MRGEICPDGVGWVQPTRLSPSHVGFTHPTPRVIPFHLDGLREGGEAVPLPESVAEWVEV